MTNSNGVRNQTQRTPFASLPKNLVQASQDAVDTVLDFIFPPKCVGCRRAGSLLCADCQSKIEVPAAISSPPLSECHATAYYDGAIQDAIHKFKYEGQHRFAPILGDRLVQTLRQIQWHPSLIVAAPISQSRLKERGYNQAALLAERVSRKINVPFEPAALSKTRDTKQQMTLNYEERQINLLGAMRADPAMVAGSSALIIDDVYTTGATLRECATALVHAGSVEVRGLTVARAKRQREY